MNLPNGWKKVKLGDVCSLLSGQDFAPELYSDETLGTPYITGASNFANNHIVLNRWTNCPRCIAHRGEILLVCKGSGFGTLAIADFESAHIARQIMALQNLKGVDRDFLFNVIATNFLNIKQKGCGLIPGIDRKTVLNISFALPPLAEQKKIAETLSVWDSAIEKMEKLVVLQNKRFQQMLKEHIVEKIDDGAWDTCRVGDLFDAVTRKNKENCKNVLTSSAQLGLVNQQEYYKKSVSALDVTGYYLLKKGEFAYNRSSSTGYPFGVVKRLDRYETGVLSTLYLCMGIKNEKKCYSDFFVYLFESGCLEKQLSLICREGARNHGLLNVSKEDFFNMSVPVPSLNEQKRIAEFLLANEKELSLLKQQLALYKKQKQGLMQKLLTGEWRVK